jgi:hypothetical protein
MAESLYQELLAQIEELEQEGRQLGMSKGLPRGESSREVRRLAMRLFRATVLKLDPDEIRLREKNDYIDDDTYQPVSALQIIRSVRRWGRELDVPLPPRFA